MAEAKSPYVPTNDELSDEVADVLIDLDNSTPSAKEVLQALLERNESWSIPEHRVAKFVDEYNLRRGEFGPPTDDDDSVRSGASRGSASDGDRRGRFIVKGASHSIRKILSGKTKAAKQKLGITRLDRRKMHFKEPQKTRPRRPSRPDKSNNDLSSDHSSSDHNIIGGDSPVGQSQSQTTSQSETQPTTTTTTMQARTAPAAPMDDDSKAEKVPPKRPQRTYSDYDELENDAEEEEQVKSAASAQGEKVRETPERNSSFGEINTDHIMNGSDDDEDDDADIIEEADKRSKFMTKGGSHSIQKVLKGDARKKKGFSRFDRRNMQFNKGIPAPGSKDKGENLDDTDNETRATEKTSVSADVLDVLGDSYNSENMSGSFSENIGNSYSENIDLDELDGEAFAAEVERRSKFMAKGGAHSIKKVLAGEARAKKSTGPSRINRRNIPSSPEPNSNDANDDTDVEEEEVMEVDEITRDKPRGPPIRTISVDSTDSQIEDEANKRSLFMVKGGSHSIRNLFAGKAKKEKRGSMLDRRKMHFKHEADAAIYTQAPHPKPEEINEARLKAEAEAKQKALERKANKFGRPKPPKRNKTFNEDEQPSPTPPAAEKDDVDDDDDEALEAEADRRSLMFKGGSHSIRNLFAGKAKQMKAGVSRLNRRKMHFKKESDAVHYTEKPRLKPEEINARHQEEAARLREQGDAEAAKPARKAPIPPKPVGNAESSSPGAAAKGGQQDPSDSQPDAQGDGGDNSSDVNIDDYEDDDEDIIEEADKRSKFMLQGGSYSIQKVLKGEARAKKGVNRFDRRKMHFKHESEALHSHDHDGEKQEPSDSQPDVQDEGGDNSADADVDEPYSDEDDDDADADIIEEADKRSKFMMKGGSYSIQKVLRGEARAKKGVNRFDRRKMHFKHESEAIHCHDHDGEKQEPSDSQPDERGDNSADADVDEPYSDEDDDDADADIIEEADKRSKFMMKGGSYSIQKVLRGEARAKKGVNRFDRRKMHFKHESEAIHCHDHDGEKQEPSDSQPDDRGSNSADADVDEPYNDEDDDDADIIEEADKRSKFMMKGGSHSIQKVLRGEARVKKGVNRFDRRKMHFNRESADGQASEATPGDKAAADSVTKPAPTDTKDSSMNDSAGSYIDADADIIEEADKRSKFMMKGGSYSIQKVLRGEARAKKGVNRFDRRKMHFKHESEALHSHDGEMASQAPKDHVVRKPARKESTEATSGQAANKSSDDNSEELDEDERQLLAEAEADPRKRMMLKGASHSIRNIFSGKAKKEKKAAAGMERRMSQLKTTQLKHAGGMGDESDRRSARGEDASVSASTRDAEARAKVEDRRSRFTLKGASNSIRNLLGRKSGNKKPIDDEIARLQSREASSKGEFASSEISKDDEDDMDEEDRAIEAEADLRSNFIAKGGSYSITKVLSGNARKKKEGITRFDRRKMHFKNESEEVVPSPNRDSQDTSTSKPQEDVEKEQIKSAEGEPKDNANTGDLESGDDDDLDDEDAEILAEADKRSSFMSKGGSYSIQKVLKGEARAKKGVSRFDRRKMHFKHESEAIHSHDHDGETSAQAKRTSSDVAPANPTGIAPKMPARRTSDDGTQDEAEASNDKKDNTTTTQASTVDLCASPKGDPKDDVDEKEEDDDNDDEDTGDDNRRKRFSLKGASHSIKKVLSGKARAKKETGVSRLDRRRIHLKSKSTPRGDMDVPKPTGGK